MISSDVIRGYNDTIILHLLLEKDSYGYEISKEIERRSEGNYMIKETTLYSAFSRLEKNGFLVSYQGDETFGRKRTYYKITNAGREYYQKKCQEWGLTKKVINVFTREDIENESN
ncbi:MAG: PadR family transcriptional regulator [Anaerovorax sp.]|nr:PadR family transcriptional regulator [Anaerovorax sp.]